MFRKFSFPIEKFLELAKERKIPTYEKDGKKYVNLTIFDKFQTDEHGKDFFVQADKFKDDWDNPSIKPTLLCDGKFMFTRKERDQIEQGVCPSTFGGHKKYENEYEKPVDKPKTNSATDYERNNNIDDVNSDEDDDLPF